MIQVCYEVNTRNKEREINGLLEAMETFGLDKGYILTFNQKDEIILGDQTISIIPARKFDY